MSYLLPHLRTGWAVDQAIINEEERVVCLRFGHDHDVTCMQMDEVLAGIAEDVKNFCAIYVVDVSEVCASCDIILLCRVTAVVFPRVQTCVTNPGWSVCLPTREDYGDVQYRWDVNTYARTHTHTTPHTERLGTLSSR